MTGAAAGRWQFWIDRGGTFTDVVALDPAGRLHRHKLLSEHPERYRDAALQGIRDLLGLPAGSPLPAARIAAVKMGTTVATNALLERRGAPTLLVVDQGLGDALRIGDQTRPEIFARRITRPEPLYAEVLEVAGRLDARGRAYRPLDLDAARAGLEAAYRRGLRSVAIVLMHAYRYPEPERRLASLARDVGFEQVSASHEVSPAIKWVSRGQTTVADAYLSPVLRRYVEEVRAELGRVPLLFMQSSGGLVEAERFRGRNSILSGPAGGVVGAVKAAAAAGCDRIVGFDMGGTSTDVCHYAGEYERSLESVVAGLRLRAPMMRIHTVAAGGGSVLHFDGARYRVGPDSAGADPGPACYRRGGPLTVTDCNLMLGRIQPDYFPRVFGPGGDQPLDRAAVERGFGALAQAVGRATGEAPAPEAVAAGFLEVAVEHMAAAIKEISVARGYDVAGYTLVCFGGAGAQHACRVADALGMTRVLVPPLAGVLSAYGIGVAERRALREQAVEAPLDAALMAGLEALYAPLVQAARRELGGGEARVLRRLRLRYAGTDTPLELAPEGDAAALRRAFEDLHRRRFGFTDPDRDLVADSLSVELVAEEAAAPPAEAAGADWPFPPPAAGDRVRLHAGGDWHSAPVTTRERLSGETPLAGPALVVEPDSTVVVEPGWQARPAAGGGLLLERRRPAATARRGGTARDPVRLEVFNKLFMSVAEQMGATLAKTACSVNIKERLDFSCALFDAAGRLVANAPHVPVHLGSMGDSVAHVLARRQGRMRPGEVYVHNDPYRGGTHLPDVTVITPVFLSPEDAAPRFLVASRGHHADVGGLSPGSMPPDSRRLEDEGVLLDDVLLVRDGRFLEAEILARLTAGPHPARDPAQNLADLRAQVAANTRGVEELRRLVDQYGLETVEAYMAHVRENAAESVRRVIGVLRDGRYTCALDNGAEIHVAVTVDRARRRAVVDFTGTSPQRPDNFNAPASICKAAVLYVFRSLVDDDIPLNSGCLEPLALVIPAGSLLNPRPPAAVVAGNVETSQVLVDALYGALGALAASQGTMNNFTFGDARWQYYETLCGGTGAGPDFDGAGGVHAHMTNSRLTDPEVLELRYPVLLEAFALRRGSGGAGAHRGGDGVVRRLRFLAPLEAAVLSNRRRVAPFGLAGGRPGQCGRNYVIRADGRLEELPGCARVRLAPGDQFVIETPGGGGFGAPREAETDRG